MRSLESDRAVVGAGSCARWSRIVRSLEPDRAVVAAGLCGRCSFIVLTDPENAGRTLVLTGQYGGMVQMIRPRPSAGFGLLKKEFGVWAERIRRLQ